jgi:hypothetical protein
VKRRVFASPVRHQSRQWIEQILRAAKGKHIFPKAVFDAQTPPMDMHYAAIRKLMREMLRRGLRRDKDGYYLITSSSHSHYEINTARRTEFRDEARMLIEQHRRQRHTAAPDFVWALEELLHEQKAKLTSRE